MAIDVSALKPTQNKSIDNETFYLLDTFTGINGQTINLLVTESGKYALEINGQVFEPSEAIDYFTKEN